MTQIRNSRVIYEIIESITHMNSLMWILVSNSRFFSDAIITQLRNSSREKNSCALHNESHTLVWISMTSSSSTNSYQITSQQSFVKITPPSKKNCAHFIMIHTLSSEFGWLHHESRTHVKSPRGRAASQWYHLKKICAHFIMSHTLSSEFDDFITSHELISNHLAAELCHNSITQKNFVRISWSVSQSHQNFDYRIFWFLNQDSRTHVKSPCRCELRHNCITWIK